MTNIYFRRVKVYIENKKDCYIVLYKKIRRSRKNSVYFAGFRKNGNYKF